MFLFFVLVVVVVVVVVVFLIVLVVAAAVVAVATVVVAVVVLAVAAVFVVPLFTFLAVSFGMRLCQGPKFLHRLSLRCLFSHLLFCSKISGALFRRCGGTVIGLQRTINRSEDGVVYLPKPLLPVVYYVRKTTVTRTYYIHKNLYKSRIFPIHIWS